ncbi:mannose-1-phosphate guanylyltransferase [Planktosalinus lacus]|uniref:mannose-1-phosphate guanylyltransferase n=1 Tax=Planktosalinus lacus TaxID=1526573 RepID=A0A8J2Y7C9_9FLAO|nr:mannose-1-phosphate guanylyltransferase [Planktosalinus lacus]GGD87042.1 mannose-1-phosphate guanylyltransferase [Planktosalinus lacus]
MAGGIGSRFWPVSTEEFPKQFHDLLGSGDTLIQKTFKRLSAIVPNQNILILTNERYKNLVLKQLPEVKEDQLILEPAMRNTAPCILLSALKIQKQNPNAVMMVAPSDHWIEDENAFNENISTAFENCSKNNVLMTLGIQPTFPNTGYGYIEFEKTPEEIKKVLRFTEKPDYSTAKTFLAAGNFMWNAGIFVWSVKSIVSSFEKFAPQMHQLFQSGISNYNTSEEETFIKEKYPSAENISIDYAILEKAENVYMLPATFDWNDLGTWGSLYDKLPKDEQNNVTVGANALFLESKNNIIHTEKDKQVVLSNLMDYIIVDNGKTLIIVPKEKEQEIKQMREIALKKFN